MGGMVAASPALAQGPRATVVVDGLSFPTGIAFSPDGDLMYVNEREGSIRVVDDGGLRADPIASLPTTTAGETGLLGIAVSPDGESLYVFATDPGGSSNRVIRVPAEGGEPEIVVSDLPASVYHNGGGVEFDRDGMLLVSNGEVHASSNAQDPDVRGGKVYRFTTEGDPAPGNPFGESIALGLRNPYGIALDPITGDSFVTDNGPSSDDEINRITVGGNYGWPDVLGNAGDARPSGPGEYHDPVSVQESIVVPTGIAVADPANAGAEIAGDVFYGTYSEQTIHRIRLDDDRATARSDEVFVTEDEPVIALEWGPRGLYYSTPTAIKLLPLAQPADRSPTTETRATPRRSPSPSEIAIPDGENGPPWAALAVAAGIAVVGTGGFFLFRRRLP